MIGAGRKVKMLRKLMVSVNEAALSAAEMERRDISMLGSLVAAPIRDMIKRTPRRV